MQFLTMTAKSFREMTKKENKYHTQKTTVGGIEFDSKKESKRFMELQYLEKAGKIKDLQRQVRFILQDGFIDRDGNKIRPISYLADYYYVQNGQKVVEDCKSPATRTQVYLVKKKMFLFRYRDIKFIET